MRINLRQLIPSQLSDIYFLLGFHIILFIFLLVFMQSLLYAFQASVVWWIFPLILSLVTLSLWHLYNAKISQKTAGVGVLLLCIISAIGISGYILDNSYDGNAYHKAAIGSLAHGWNPVWDTIETFNNQPTTSPRLAETHSLWTNHYPKAQWIYSAILYKMTGNIESGKSLLILLMTAAFFILYSYLKLRLNRLLAGIVSLIAVCNPVAIAQIFSYYNDGILGSLLIVFTIALVMVIDKSRNKPGGLHLYITLLLVMVCALLINIKFTGLVYAAIYAFVFMAFIVWRRNDYKDLRLIRRLLFIGCASLLIGIFVIGLSTYPKNFIKNQHPLYPLYGSGAVDIITFLEPPGFSEKNRADKLYISLSGTSSNNKNPENQAMKVPFSVTKEEVDSFGAPDVHIGGFGVFFGGIIYLSLLLCIIYLKKGYRHLRERGISLETSLLLVPLVATITTVALLSDSWWARYVPQLYWLPILLLVILAIKRKYLAVVILSVIMVCNLAVIAYAQIKTNYEATSLHHQQIDSLISRCNKYPKINPGAFSGNAYNLYDACNRVSVIKTPPAGKKPYSVYNTTVYY